MTVAVGNVRASVKGDLRATASVAGNITAPLLVKAEGAVVSGQIDAAGETRQAV